MNLLRLRNKDYNDENWNLGGLSFWKNLTTKRKKITKMLMVEVIIINLLNEINNCEKIEKTSFLKRSLLSKEKNPKLIRFDRIRKIRSNFFDPISKRFRSVTLQKIDRVGKIFDANFFFLQHSMLNAVARRKQLFS